MGSINCYGVEATVGVIALGVNVGVGWCFTDGWWMYPKVEVGYTGFTFGVTAGVTKETIKTEDVRGDENAMAEILAKSWRKTTEEWGMAFSNLILSRGRDRTVSVGCSRIVDSHGSNANIKSTEYLFGLLTTPDDVHTNPPEEGKMDSVGLSIKWDIGATVFNSIEIGRASCRERV